MQPPGETSDEFEDLVHRLREQPAESEWLEFKVSYGDPDGIGQYVSALANAAALHGESYGYMVWGIQDQTHAIVGSTFDLRTAKKGNQALEPWLLANLRPDPGVKFYRGSVNGQSVAILEIPAASHTPVLFAGVAYIRIGSHKKKLNDHPNHASQLYRNLDETPFEHRIAVDGLMQDEALEMIDYRAFFRLQDQPVPTSTVGVTAQLVAAKILIERPSGRYAISNMGGLLFAMKLSEFPRLARKAPRVIKYHGINKLSTEREQLGVHGYAAGFTGLVAYIDALLPRNEVIGQALRQEVSMFPPKAIREIVANALIHQDFSVSGAGPMIELYDDRIVITNPGTPLVDPARFVDAFPRSRNEKLAYVMRLCHICEERGSGWDRIAFEIEFHQLPAPLVRVSDDHTAVTLYAHRPVSKMDRDERIRAVYLHACLRQVSGQRMTNSSVRERFGMKDREASTASVYIREAVGAGLVVPFDPSAGKKNMQYVPVWAQDAAHGI